MDDNRFELGVMFFGAGVLPLCGAALVWGGCVGHLSPATTMFFGIAAIIGTIMAVVEIRKTLAENERRRLARARREAEAKAARAEALRLSWGERIRRSNAEMGIHVRPANAHPVRRRIAA